MKKILLAIGCFLSVACVNMAGAQSSFTTQFDTVTASYVGSDLTLHNNITNTTTAPIKIDWNVAGHNFPASWTTAEALGICDNSICWQNTNNDLTNGTVHTSLDYVSGVAGDFHLQLDLSNGVSGTYYMTVLLKENGGAYLKPVTFIVNKGSTSVGSTARADNNITLFPNPARNMINISFGTGSGIRNIAVYNLIGKMVTSCKVPAGSNRASLDINNIPSGIYYARLQNAQGEVVATRRFTRQ